MKRALRWAPSLARQNVPIVQSVRLNCTATVDARNTAYYKITPTTKTEIVAHDAKAAAITKALYIDCLPPGKESYELWDLSKTCLNFEN